MKKIGLTQRVTMIEKYNERRDSLDQRWWQLVEALGFIPVPLANLSGVQAAQYAKALDLSAIILTGGDADSARDEFEFALLSWAIPQRLPIVGICRGMQVINHYLDGSLVSISGHAAVSHRIEFYGQWKNLRARDVNSYHNFGIYPDNLAKNLEATAMHKDGTIEAFTHTTEKISGIMWHPEREHPLIKADVTLLKGLLT